VRAVPRCRGTRRREVLDRPAAGDAVERADHRAHAVPQPVAEYRARDARLDDGLRLGARPRRPDRRAPPWRRICFCGSSGRSPTMITLRSLNRLQAAGIHLALSVVLAATVLTALLFVWYPQPYFRLAGGAGLMMILIGVDVVLGPAMTLVVFNPAKKSLRFDLAVIAALQVAALAYGISVIAQARPAYVVFAGDRFTVVGANMIDGESLASAHAPYDTLPVDGPKIVGAKMPTNAAEREKVMMLGLGGIDLPMLPRYYVPFAEIVADLQAKAQPIDGL